MLNDFIEICRSSALKNDYQQLIQLSGEAYSVKNGNIAKWDDAISHIKQCSKGNLSVENSYLLINADNDDKQLSQYLTKFTPWRKGPFKIGDVNLDSEWNGFLKWQRVITHIKPLTGKAVLDVGCGNGYFTLQMALAGAKLALGIEPFLLFNYQFSAIRSLINNPPNAFVLPLRLEQIEDMPVFDVVFSMGVLYHQKDHMAHLRKLKNMLADNAQLVLETLIISDCVEEQIIPQGRYARMRNVWCLPSVKTLTKWLEDTGFSSIELVDINQTTVHEQRATKWIGGNASSLKDFLDKNDNNLTVEGYPAPKRAIFICSV